MPNVQDRQTKTERLELRLSPATRSLLTHAARLRHTTITEFLISSAVKAAEDAMLQPRLFEIETDAGWTVLETELNRSIRSPPDDALTALLRATAPVRA